MSELEGPNASVFAAAFVDQKHVVWYAEDFYAFNAKRGIHQRKSAGWINREVFLYLDSQVGKENFEPNLVDCVVKAIKFYAYVDEKHKPPFWIDTQNEASVIVTTNGIIPVEGFEQAGAAKLLPHDSNLFAVCGVPFQYDPNAGCQKWLEFVRWMVDGDEEQVRLLQQFCAWVFVAAKLKLEKILWLCGPGKNGKSTFMRIVRYVIGEDATSAVGLDAFSGSSTFQLVPTLHKLANFCSDAVIKRKRNVAALNAYVSGDPVTINRKFREQLTIEPTTVCFFGSNPLPMVDDQSDAFWRRLLLIRCEQRLSDDQVNPTLLQELRVEAPGILNWMLSAIPDLLEKKRFDVPNSVLKNVKSVKSEANSFRQFCTEKLEVGDESNDFVYREQLMMFYQDWCKQHFFHSEDLGAVKNELIRRFGTLLHRRRLGTRKERVQGWSGIKWKSDEAPPQSTKGMLLSNANNKVEQQEAKIRKLESSLRDLELFVEKPTNCHKNQGFVGVSNSVTPMPQNAVACEQSDETFEDILKGLKTTEEREIAVQEGG